MRVWVWAVNLKKEEKQANEIVASLKKDKKKYQQQLAAKKKQVEALNREIERLVASAMKGAKATTSSSKNKMIVDTKLDAEFAKNKGKLPWPADGPVVDKFGEKYHPVYKNVKLPSNNGVDIALPHGTKVCAVFSGVVRQIVVMPGYNKCVLVQHGSDFTFCLQEDTADLGHLLCHVGSDFGLGSDGIAEVVTAAGTDRSFCDGLVALHQYTFSHFLVPPYFSTVMMQSGHMVAQKAQAMHFS